MKIHPAIILAAVVFIGILIWFLSTAEFSNTDMTTDYVEPITDSTGASLSGSNLIVMDPVSGNMKLAPVDKFNTNTQSNLNKVVSDKVPGQITTAVSAIRGNSGQTKYTGSLRDLYNVSYTKSESDSKYEPKDSDIIKTGQDIKIEAKVDAFRSDGRPGGRKSLYYRVDRHEGALFYGGVGSYGTEMIAGTRRGNIFQLKRDPR